MTASAPSINDPRAEIAMRKYMQLLNEITKLGVHGFAALLDTATAAEMTELIAAADIVQRNLDRAKR
jgi:hypothetical protein